MLCASLETHGEEVVLGKSESLATRQNYQFKRVIYIINTLVEVPNRLNIKGSKGKLNRCEPYKALAQNRNWALLF